MSHYHCEIVIPPTTEVESGIESVMKQFDENDKDARHAFWDSYVIGGRWSGHKLEAGLDQDKLAAFNQWLVKEKITVSGVTCGKQTLEPTNQRLKVDQKWNEMFPSETPQACPIFDHSPKTLESDICVFQDAMDIKCGRVIFAGPAFDGPTKQWTGPVEAKFMLCDDAWNGVNHMPITWDETMGGAVAQFRRRLEYSSDSYREKCEPKDDWLAVTVDYHN